MSPPRPSVSGPAASSAGSDRLRELLRTDPPASVAALPADAQDRLATLIADARDRQAADLVAAFEATLKHVPFPARGIARKVLLG